MFNLSNISGTPLHISEKIIRNVESRISSLPMHVNKHMLYLLAQHIESYGIWSAIIRINTEGKSLNMKLGPGFSLFRLVIKDCIVLSHDTVVSNSDLL